MMAQQISRISWVKGWWAFWERRTWSPGRKRNAVDAAETDTAWTNWNSSWRDWMFSYMCIYYTCTYIYILLYMQSLSQLLNCKNLLLCRFIIVHFLLLFVIDEIIVLFYILSYPRSLSCTFFGGEANIELWLYFRDHILTILINRIWSLYGWAIKMYANNWNPFFFLIFFFKLLYRCLLVIWMNDHFLYII